MTVIAGVSIAAEDFVLGQVLAATTTRIDLTQFVPVDGEFIPYFWKEHDGDSDEFEQAVRDHPGVASLIDLDGRVNASLYQIEWAEGIDGFLSALQEHDIMVEEGFTNHGDEWLFRLRAVNQDEMSAFQTACFDHDVHLDVRRVMHNPDTGRQYDHLEDVTEKQQEALTLAVKRGYFDVPRGTSQTELAEEMGISRQAFARRLQRGLQSILINLLPDP